MNMIQDKLTLEDRIASYANSESQNDSIWEEFMMMTDQVEFLKQHCDHVEKKQLGFGDRAFHYMWYLLLSHIHSHQLNRNILEIGFFKGQIISLWALICKKLRIDFTIQAIIPLAGNPEPRNKLVYKIKELFLKRFKEDKQAGNFYSDDDYLSIIQQLFQHFTLNFNGVKLLQGYSDQAAILNQLDGINFGLVYIDGDHSYQGACNDIRK